MTTVNDVDEKTFPVLSKKKEKINVLYIGGDKNMAGLDLIMYKDGLKIGRAEGKAEGILQGKINTIIEFYKKKLITLDFASKELGMTEREFLEYVK